MTGWEGPVDDCRALSAFSVAALSKLLSHAPSRKYNNADDVEGGNPQMVERRAVLVEHDGGWLPGHVLWSYEDVGRRRALVRYETSAGLTVRELRWADELRRPAGLVFSLTSAADNDDDRDRAELRLSAVE